MKSAQGCKVDRIGELTAKRDDSYKCRVNKASSFFCVISGLLLVTFTFFYFGGQQTFTTIFKGVSSDIYEQKIRRLSNIPALKNPEVQIFTIREDTVISLRHSHIPSDSDVITSDDPVLKSVRNITEDKTQASIGTFKSISKFAQWKNLQAYFAGPYQNIPIFSRQYSSDVNELPFTQGLLLTNKNTFIESAGLYGGSLLREVDLHDGKVVRYVRLPDFLFGEGCTLFRTWSHAASETASNLNSHNETLSSESPYQHSQLGLDDNIFILQLTWREGLLLVYKYTDFALVAALRVTFSGWGLTSNFSWDASLQPKHQRVWATSSHNVLYELDSSFINNAILVALSSKAYLEPQKTFPDARSKLVPVVSRKNLYCLGVPFIGLNELEYDEKWHTIYGNIFGSHLIFGVDPETGTCTSIISMRQLYHPDDFEVKDPENVFNGVALTRNFKGSEFQDGDPVFLVTGKRWPSMYFVTLLSLSMTAGSGISTWSDLLHRFPFFVPVHST